MASLSEAVLGAMPPTSTRPFQGPGTQADASRRSPYLEPFTWFGLHSILMVTLAGG